MRLFLGMVVVAALAAPAQAQWFARGEFNGWDTTDPLIFQGQVNGVDYYTADITGLFEETDFFFKVATEDYSMESPPGFGQDIRVRSDANGNIKVHFYDSISWNDGWFPNSQRRVGYDDHGLFDWEIVGSFNGWPGTGDPNFFLTDMGNGLHSGTFTFDAGIYDFKFRQQGDWNTNIGNNGFSNNAGNNQFAVANDGDQWLFELDLVQGKWRRELVSPPGLPGDHNGDGIVDAADYVAWRKSNIDGEQGYTDWRANFGRGAAAASWIAFSPQFGTHELTDLGGGEYTVTVSGLTPEQDYEYKFVRSDLSDAAPPGNNVSVRANTNGEVTLNLYELQGASWDDGWFPNTTHRAGYEDHGLFGWELMGDMNGWGGGTEWYLTDHGNGLHSVVADLFAGSYEFKFRMQDNWDVNIGAQFSNHGDNAEITLDSDGLWEFVLDLPGGKWQVVPFVGSGLSNAVPEPTSLVLVLIGSLLAGGQRRRR